MHRTRHGDAPASQRRGSRWSGGRAGCSERLLSDLDEQRAPVYAWPGRAPALSRRGALPSPSPDLGVVRFLPQPPSGSLPSSSARETVAHAPRSVSGGRVVLVPYGSHAKPPVAHSGQNVGGWSLTGVDPEVGRRFRDHAIQRTIIGKEFFSLKGDDDNG